MWILGSSLFGAQLAAHLGLPFSFASHFAPGDLDGALAVYRERFRPSPRWPMPYVMPALSVVAAPTDEEARLLFTSLQQSFANLRTGKPGRMPPPKAGVHETFAPEIQAMLAQALACAVVGSPERVKAGIAAFAERTQADELMVTGPIFDFGLRKRSFDILARVAGR
jgi:luciferase family oxidoreductase group 1